MYRLVAEIHISYRKRFVMKSCVPDDSVFCITMN